MQVGEGVAAAEDAAAEDAAEADKCAKFVDFAEQKDARFHVACWTTFFGHCLGGGGPRHDQMGVGFPRASAPERCVLLARRVLARAAKRCWFS